MWIVDSTVWIDYFTGRPSPQSDLLDRALGHRRIGLVDIVLCEVLQGFRSEGDFAAARSALQRFPTFTVGGTDIALKSAANFRFLRRNGITVRSTVYCLIATFVIQHQLALLHHDRDYDAFEEHLGLRVVRPAPSDGSSLRP